jgi:hypothetical protein
MFVTTMPIFRGLLGIKFGSKAKWLCHNTSHSSKPDRIARNKVCHRVAIFKRVMQGGEGVALKRADLEGWYYAFPANNRIPLLSNAVGTVVVPVASAPRPEVLLV